MSRRGLEAARWTERPGDARRFERWCADPANAEAFERAAAARRAAAAVADRSELAALRAEALARAAAREPRGMAWRPALATAAALALAVGLPAFLMLDAGPGRDRTVAADATETFRTARGQRLAWRLPDGSRLMLDTASEVRVAFRASERRLELRRGQALFDVAEDPARPFVVEADGRSVVARGTRFNVRISGEELRVALMEGEVVVSGAGVPGTPMKPNELLTADRAGVTVRRDEAAVAALTGWSEGRLVFQDQPLAQAVAEMNRYAAKPILLADDGVGRIRISGSFRTGEAEPFLGALRLGFPIEVGRRGDGAVLLSKRR